MSSTLTPWRSVSIEIYRYRQIGILWYSNRCSSEREFVNTMDFIRRAGTGHDDEGFRHVYSGGRQIDLSEIDLGRDWTRPLLRSRREGRRDMCERCFRSLDGVRLLAGQRDSERARAERYLVALKAVDRAFQPEVSKGERWAAVEAARAVIEKVDVLSPKPAEPAEPAKPVRSCNRHINCDEADEEARAKGRVCGDHCHDECCEDCFGS